MEVLTFSQADLIGSKLELPEGVDNWRDAFRSAVTSSWAVNLEEELATDTDEPWTEFDSDLIASNYRGDGTYYLGNCFQVVVKGDLNGNSSVDIEDFRDHTGRTILKSVILDFKPDCIEFLGHHSNVSYFLARGKDRSAILKNDRARERLGACAGKGRSSWC
jgi:hypothetical protein